MKLNDYIAKHEQFLPIGLVCQGADIKKRIEIGAFKPTAFYIHAVDKTYHIKGNKAFNPFTGEETTLAELISCIDDDERCVIARMNAEYEDFDENGQLKRTYKDIIYIKFFDLSEIYFD